MSGLGDFISALLGNSGPSTTPVGQTTDAGDIYNQLKGYPSTGSLAADTGLPSSVATADVDPVAAGVSGLRYGSELAGSDVTKGDRPKKGGKVAELLPIPQVNPGASGVIDPTVPPAPVVTKASPNYVVTPEQRKALAPMYGRDEAAMRNHIGWAIGSGQPGMPAYTPEQLQHHHTQVLQNAGTDIGSYKSIIAKALGGG